MRGKAARPRAAPERPGITPAYAGKRSTRTSNTLPPWDHPRVCGEKIVCIFVFELVLGSPPRMRGKETYCTLRMISPGITPAYAGKSLHDYIVDLTKWDHPRVCGEKLLNHSDPLITRGSPPRMRGKGPRGLGPHGRKRITPAYAGKRLKRSHRIGHFSCILCLFHSVLHRASASGGSRAGPCAPPCLPAQNAVPV